MLLSPTRTPSSIISIDPNLEGCSPILQVASAPTSPIKSVATEHLLEPQHHTAGTIDPKSANEGKKAKRKREVSANRPTAKSQRTDPSITSPGNGRGKSVRKRLEVIMIDSSQDDHLPFGGGIEECNERSPSVQHERIAASDRTGTNEATTMTNLAAQQRSPSTPTARPATPESSGGGQGRYRKGPYRLLGTPTSTTPSPLASNSNSSHKTTTASAASTSTTTTSVPMAQGARVVPYKFVPEPVRKRDERETMPAHECHMCRAVREEVLL